ncbi:HEAT repeat domain-containing protein [Amycolatopsis sp. lyj-109]|uniref:HEAT repeat domain-containing protein n=1 Tax=Amycolatopsis sp. lyj-109 TaxID=2789287 RepID=UPI003977F75D
MPSTGRAAAAAFAAAAADPDARVRAAALAAARMAKAAAAPAARTALTDPEPTVRAEAIRTLAALGTPDLDPEVAWQTMRALTASGELLVADLAPLLARPDPHTRRSAVWHLIEAGGEATALLEPALDDEDPYVRVQAVQTADRRDERSLLPALRRRKAVETDSTVLVNLGRVISAWS